MMDLRWGIREQSLNDHTIIEFCLREIDKCKTKSIGPNFVVSGVLPSLYCCIKMVIFAQWFSFFTQHSVNVKIVKLCLLIVLWFIYRQSNFAHKNDETKHTFPMYTVGYRTQLKISTQTLFCLTTNSRYMFALWPLFISFFVEKRQSTKIHLTITVVNRNMGFNISGVFKQYSIHLYNLDLNQI